MSPDEELYLQKWQASVPDDYKPRSSGMIRRPNGGACIAGEPKRQPVSPELRAAGLALAEQLEPKQAEPEPPEPPAAKPDEGISPEKSSKSDVLEQPPKKVIRRSEAIRNERHAAIAALRTEDPDISVRDLAKALAVSETTIQRDLRGTR
jgi:hypothetical protein